MYDFILSENYASTQWYLDELHKIMECKEKNGQLVIPIFYMVDHSNVAKRFEHEDEYKVTRCKEVLTLVAGLS